MSETESFTREERKRGSTSDAPHDVAYQLRRESAVALSLEQMRIAVPCPRVGAALTEGTARLSRCAALLRETGNNCTSARASIESRRLSTRLYICFDQVRVNQSLIYCTHDERVSSCARRGVSSLDAGTINRYVRPQPAESDRRSLHEVSNVNGTRAQPQTPDPDI